LADPPEIDIARNQRRIAGEPLAFSEPVTAFEDRRLAVPGKISR
jgi:hypothetical protein